MTRANDALATVQALAARKTKFGNIPTEVDGLKFDSRKEARRYSELRLLERSGRISALTLQPAFPLDVNGYPICRYVADFAYVEAGARVVEDVKSAITRKHPVYRLKVKLMRACLGIEVREV